MYSTVPAQPYFHPATTTLPTPGDCNVQDLDPSAKLFYNLTFLRLSKLDDLLVTPDGVLRVFGEPQPGTLVGTLGKTFTFDGIDDAAELECVPCISDLLNCASGFTLQVDVNFQSSSSSIDTAEDTVQLGWDANSFTNSEHVQSNPEASERPQDTNDNVHDYTNEKLHTRKNTTEDSKYRAVSGKVTYILDSIEDPTRDMGMELFYGSSKIHVTLQASKGKWIIEEPYELKPNTVYRIQVSWQSTGNLALYVDGFLVCEASRVSLPRVNYYQSRPLLLGRERNGRQDSTISLSELFIWMSTREALQQRGLIAGYMPVFRIP